MMKCDQDEFIVLGKSNKKWTEELHAKICKIIGKFNEINTSDIYRDLSLLYRINASKFLSHKNIYNDAIGYATNNQTRQNLDFPIKRIHDI
jgi:hypothetical protein